MPGFLIGFLKLGLSFLPGVQMAGGQGWGPAEHDKFTRKR